MPRLVAVLGILLVALASCAVSAALVRADEGSLRVDTAQLLMPAAEPMAGAARAKHIKEWQTHILAQSTEPEKTSAFIFEDTGEDFHGGPVVKVIIPGSHFCIVAINPANSSEAAMLGCAPLTDPNDRKHGT